MRKLSIRHRPHKSSTPPPHIWSSRGTKRTRAGLCRSSVDSQSNGIADGLTTPSSSEDEPDWQSLSLASSEYVSENESSASLDEAEPWYHKLQGQEFKPHQPCHWNPQIQQRHQDLHGHRLELRQLISESFERWSAGREYTALPDEGLPPRKRFKTSRLQSSVPRMEEVDGISDEKLVMVSHPVRSRNFFRLACPFHIYAPGRFQQCLIQDNLQSIEDVIKHLLRHHSRLPYCYICNESFETVIHRDDHILDNACTKRDPDPIAGLIEDQKAMLTRKDCYYWGEKKRWYRVWSIVFPTCEPPRSPYLDRGLGLIISMARDFWDLNGHQCVSDFLRHQDSDGEKDENSHYTLFELALDDLLNCIVDEHESLKIQSIGE
ncbi:hypothetical protein FSARC_3231 [Fusarium sarcochroum]|uniref:Uncharacterized protein n=1 Tax=Fusarium sarcochroum TaxID=1208366 RepID=A0A8H4U4Y0_9HYPO|nr:hypothetical protein FSARC_3231 [Fusarium sarcochroum]